MVIVVDVDDDDDEVAVEFAAVVVGDGDIVAFEFDTFAFVAFDNDNHLVFDDHKIH